VCDYFSYIYPDGTPEQNREQEALILRKYQETATFCCIAEDYLFQLKNTLSALNQKLDALMEET